ncbi:MAG: dihydrodipicolinate synthase family protein [Saccharothrix sp.]|nr:dihydrodipicolinate synthase family protein [Saccharothrix sp.]
MSRSPFTGVLVPLVTPIGDDGSVARAELAALIALVAPHVDGLVPALGSGEGWCLDSGQWHDVVATTVAHSAGLPVLAGVLGATTDEVIAKARSAAELGASAVVATTPYGADVTQDRMYQHFVELAEAGRVPVVVYHESEVSKNRLTHETLVRISRIPGVVAVKDSHGDLDATRRLLDEGVAVLQGGDHLMGEGLAVDGFLVALANLEPELCGLMWRSPSAGTAELILKKCADHDLFADDWYLAIKDVLHDRGVITNPLPVTGVR